MIIDNKYLIVNKLTKGGFGTVYKAQNILTEEYVIVKMEPISNTLKREAKIYKYLGKMEGFLELKWFGIYEDPIGAKQFHYLVLPLLSQTILESIKCIEESTKKEKLAKHYLHQMLTRIKQLHEKGLVHRDIKPNNFLIAQPITTSESKEEYPPVYLIDFGLCKPYIYDNKHIDNKKTSGIIGTPNFVSIHGHELNELSRRDDIESCIYVYLYLIYPQIWTISLDLQTTKEGLIAHPYVPSFIKKMLTKVRSLEFDEDPHLLYDLFNYLN